MRILQFATGHRRTAETTAAGRLDLDHLCAQVGQMPAQCVRGEQRHLEDSDVPEKFHNATFPQPDDARDMKRCALHHGD